VRPGGGGLGDGEVDGRLVFGDLDALDLFKLFDSGLHLFGFGGLGAEAVDEGFKVFYLVALVLVGGHQLQATFFLLLQILLIVAEVEVSALVPEFDCLVDGDVEKVAVVGDEYERVWIVAEVVFEPVAGFEIEMVGGLIKQQEGWLLQ
jgi:hypothetical protein